ncbi:hypothetical protein OAO01_05000 [Oligoflexia bacterium]|nr:hypothetical protein [Oligoflexia bacterium]
MIIKELIHIAIAVALYYLWTEYYAVNSVIAISLSILAYLVLRAASNIKLLAQGILALQSPYRAELIIEPNFKKLFEHPEVKSFYDRALPALRGKDGLRCGKDALLEKYHFRFMVSNGLIWSDMHKTFWSEIMFRGRIIDTDRRFENEDDRDAREEEPYLAIQLKHGFVKMYFWGKTYEDDATVISQFPLFIFDDIPYSILNRVGFGEGKDAYLKLRRLNVPGNAVVTGKIMKKIEKARIIQAAQVEKYGFESFSEGDSDVTQDIDGEYELYDPDDGFSLFKDEYMTIRVKEFFD